MATIICPNCHYNNPTGLNFCQKCGNSLIITCRRCGTASTLGTEFCGNCGVKLSEAKFALSSEAVKRWRNILSKYEGMSPVFRAGPKTLAVWGKLIPPLIPEKEPFIFDVAITYRSAGFAAHPRRIFKVHRVTVQNKTITGTWDFFAGYKWGYLLATNSRLVAYHPEARIALQVSYEQIVSLDLQNDNYILNLRDGTQAKIEASLPRTSLLGAIALIGAPPEAKGHIFSIEQTKERNADNFIAYLTHFFMEIIEENKQRGG